MSPSTPGDLERALGGGEGREGGGLSAKAGVILGIHNIFIVIPQFLVNRIGGIWASIAFVLAWRLAKELRRRQGMA
ncbi:hypothetical protein B0H13DRAFT_2019444, partial [Mycena leptocephala]